VHKFCSSCGKHFVGEFKDQITACKLMRHSIMMVEDDWEKQDNISPITMKLNEIPQT